MKTVFEEYKEKLFEIILGENHYNEFSHLIDQLYNQGKTKKEIYNLFLAFHAEIQLDKRTRMNETAYNNLSDFMDGFTTWGKASKILPNEPDL